MAVPAKYNVSNLVQMARQSAVTRRLTHLQGLADASVPVQRVKTEAMDLEEIRRIPQFWKHVTNHLGPLADRTDDTLQTLAEQLFDENHAKGVDIVGTLNARKQAEQDAPQEETRAQKSRTKTANKLHKNYTTKAHPLEQQGEYRTGSKGKGSTQEAYSNWVSLDQNALTSGSNYSIKDPNRPDPALPAPAKRKHLNNSEIFWQQWQEAVKTGVNSGRKKSSRRKAKRGELSQIKRDGVINYNTLLTAHHSLPNGQGFSSGVNVSFAPETPEFLALLGTPNGRGVGFMLQDHYHEMNNKSFGGVTLNGAERSFTFTFV